MNRDKKDRKGRSIVAQTPASSKGTGLASRSSKSPKARARAFYYPPLTVYSTERTVGFRALAHRMIGGHHNVIGTICLGEEEIMCRIRLRSRAWSRGPICRSSRRGGAYPRSLSLVSSRSDRSSVHGQDSNSTKFVRSSPVGVLFIPRGADVRPRDAAPAPRGFGREQ